MHNMQHMERTPKDELPALLLQCRVDRHLTLEDVGRAIGISKQAVSAFEARKSKLRRVNRARLIEFLRKHDYFPKTSEAA